MVPTQPPVLSFPSKAAFETWLASNHQSAPGLWLKIARKQSGHTTVDYAQALEVALCNGWIDGQKDKFDEEYWLQRFTGRGPRSKWSKINREKAEALVASGAMRPAGQAQIDAARGRPMGCGVRGGEVGHGTRGPGCRPGREPRRACLLRYPGPPQPVLHPVPGARRQEAGDPDPPGGPVRSDAR